MRKWIILAALPLLLLFCAGDEAEPMEATSSESESVGGSNEDGSVRLYLEEDGCRYSIGASSRDWGASTVNVNGSEYTPSQDSDGNWYVDMEENSSGLYYAALVTGDDPEWCDGSLYSPFLPYSQFMESTVAALAAFPMYASCSSDGDSKLLFTDAFAVLDLVLRGSEEIVSVRVEDIAGAEIAGNSVYSPSLGRLSMSGCVGFVVLNCTAADSSLGGSDKHFYLLLAPGEYSEGLRISISDSGHGAMSCDTGSITLTANEVTTLSLTYELGDVVFWETFDSFVWGGDPVDGFSGYAPDSTEPSGTTYMDRTGYEEALTEVASSVAGSAYVQSFTYSDVQWLTVGTSSNSNMSASYISSRNLGSYGYIYRSQELQGYLGVSLGTTGRGAYQTPPMARLEGHNDITLSFSFCGHKGITDDLLLQVLGSGYITSVSWDGSELSIDDDSYTYKRIGGAAYVFPNSVISSGAGSSWHTVSMDISDATGGTYFFLAGNTTTSGDHGFYLDDFKVTCRSTTPVPSTQSLRLLYWNIQNGMWADQGNDYDNFVEWVLKYDPDICVWDEARTIYEDDSSVYTTDRYLHQGWPELAARYGHSYSDLGGIANNYPTAITSKYPINTLLKATTTDDSSKPIVSGLGVHQITVSGRALTFVNLHLWAMTYGYGATDTETSAAANEGDEYRRYELDYIINRTVNNEEFSDVTDWLVVGDFNAKSRLDNWYYGYDEDSSYLVCQDVMLEQTDLVDVIYEQYPGVLVPSTGGVSRIDYVYVSPSLYSNVSYAWTVTDGWTNIVRSPYVSSFYLPSDHRPILVDFDF